MLKTGHRTKYHLRAFEFLAARRRSRAVLTCTLLASFLATMPTGGLQAGDILRGGASAGNAKRNSEARANAGAAAAEAAKVRAQDRLARTTKAVNDMRALQASARAAGANTAFNGLYHPTTNPSGGLRLLDGSDPTGADKPTASGNTVNIKQTASQALLNWQTFNVGSQTTVNFDQSAGGVDATKWIAFNKVLGSTAPSEIRGKINAQGQVYIINQNGIIFGAGSQVNTRALVASALPINDNLVKNGLLNNKDAQFLFSALEVPSSSDGTPTFTPTDVPETLGDVIVERGAMISSPELAGGNGGRVMLVGANVRNEGEISTPAGQTIIAAGLQVGVQAHKSSDPSLRGLDAWVGDVGDYAGTIINSGLIEAKTGSILAVGKQINQSGVLESTTSVNLNGRIDLLASYGAVANPNFDNSGKTGDGAPIFLNQFTGEVLLSSGSLTRILPDYESTKSVPGIKLSQNSKVNVEANQITFASDSTMLVPSGDVRLRAGVWPYKDDESNNRTIFNSEGIEEDGLTSNFADGGQRFFFENGIVQMASGSVLDVAGTPDVFVPLDQYIMDIQLRGTELADSPLQRSQSLRGKTLTVDLRRNGTYGGRFWIGTPLGDATGLANIIERNAAQLTTRGGTIEITAGSSVNLASGSEINVSGGYTRNEGGLANTTRLVKNGKIIDISAATPDVVYDGIFEESTTTSSAKWGIEKEFKKILSPMARHKERAYIEGAAGGSLKMTAPSMQVAGNLLGNTVTGPKQLNTPTGHSALSFSFKNQKRLEISASQIEYVNTIEAPPAVVFSSSSSLSGLTLSGRDLLSPIAISPLIFAENGGGFGFLSIDNTDGTIQVPKDSPLLLPAGGSLDLKATNVEFLSSVTMPGGILSVTAYNYSPFLYSEQQLLSELIGKPAPAVAEGLGIIRVGPSVALNTAGTLSDERFTTKIVSNTRRVLDGGSVTLEGYSVLMDSTSMINASGGLGVSARGKLLKGNGGSISILAGKDPLLSTSAGGTLQLPGTLQAYSSVKGGSLRLQAPEILLTGKTGDSPVLSQGTRLSLTPDFFQRGGFTEYSLIGSGLADSENPTIEVRSGTTINPIAETIGFSRSGNRGGDIAMEPILLPLGARAPASLSLEAKGYDDTYTEDKIEAIGSIVLGKDATIKIDPLGKVNLKAQTVAILGTIDAPAGKISLQADRRYPLSAEASLTNSNALATLYLSPTARLLARGTTIFTPDPYKRQTGQVLAGGTISLIGNIVAEQGALLDVSGASDKLDIHPSRLGAKIRPSANSGLTTTPWGRQSIRLQLDSNGGAIRLQGSQMLLSDATLCGFAGGPSAIGGMLSVSSGAFMIQSGADTNLIVSQSGRVIDSQNTDLGVGTAVLGSDGAPLVGNGFFTASTFSSGGFDSLDLGFEYFASASVPFGGNIEFKGPVAITAPGAIRLAAGGVVTADDKVSLNAPYIAIGQEFKPPLHPNDTFIPFKNQENEALLVNPTSGEGSLSINARLVDVGTTVLKNISNLSITASNGDIRGSGYLNVAGSINLTAGQIYPTTLAKFQIFAYGDEGSVEINQSGTRALPMSAGGNLAIYASNIKHAGTLRAPFGSITLGWDGLDTNPATEDLDNPGNLVVGTENFPVTQSLTLRAGSTTSVSAIDPITIQGIIVPFGLSPDGNSWIDPRGVNVTTAGMPEKKINLAADSIIQETDSIIDLRGGGDLLAFRWISGPGGSADILGTPSSFGSSTAYSAAKLVSYNGKTYSSRMALDPSDFNGAVPTPGKTAYWLEIPESYAILPGFGSEFAPYNPFNSTSNSNALGGDMGYVSTLKLGDRIVLDGNSVLPTGAYTLLPRRYGLMPGAYLITPVSGYLNDSTNSEGATYASAYRANSFSTTSATPAMRSSFEILTPTVLAARAEYETYKANTFIPQAAADLRTAVSQALPRDSAALAIQGNDALTLRGVVLAHSPNGLGANMDISSRNTITIGTSSTEADGIVLDASRLNSWGASSLLIGGLRRSTAAGTVVDVNTDSITLTASLTGSDLILASKSVLTLEEGSSLSSSGSPAISSDKISIAGQGALVRVSSDAGASFARTSTTGESEPNLSMKDGASLSGAGVILDSTKSASISPLASLNTQSLSLGSEKIVVDFAESSADPAALILSGDLLSSLSSSKNLYLNSYSSIDFNGSGTLGSQNLKSLSLNTGGIQGVSADVILEAASVSLANPLASTLEATESGSTLQILGERFNLGSGIFQLAGFETTSITASSGVLATGTGALQSDGSITIETPAMAASRLTNYDILASGELVLNDLPTTPTISSELGATLSLTGSSVDINSDISLPSGLLKIQATSGDVTIGSKLSVEGSAHSFYDTTRYADAGSIVIKSDAGKIVLNESAVISTSAASGGGRAGSLQMSAAEGEFQNSGKLLGKAASGYDGGSFQLDVKALTDFSSINTPLKNGGFTNSQIFRVRTGNVALDQNITAYTFELAADGGSITVSKKIDASGETGGRIALSASGSLTLIDGADFSVAANKFNSAGKGGEIYLAAGSQLNGVVDSSASLNLLGGKLDLGVASYKEGNYDALGSSAFEGKFQGKLHLRAPRTDSSLQIAAIGSSINDASAIVAEGYKLYDLTTTEGIMNIALRNLVNTDATAFMTNENSIRNALFGSSIPNNLVLAPGVEIINRNGDLTLGLANTPTGTDNIEGKGAADWDLSQMRYGSKKAPGILTLRASGDVVFNNSLSDGFTTVSPSVADPSIYTNGLSYDANGHSTLWLAQLQTINPDLPTNIQSWSYTITAGADLSSASRDLMLATSALAEDKGSVRVGEFYPAKPNSSDGSDDQSIAGTGLLGTTANNLKINLTEIDETTYVLDADGNPVLDAGGNPIIDRTGTGLLKDLGTRFEVVRTGTGDIRVNAASDVQLRNQFATIYTAGVAIPESTKVYTEGDFVVPIVNFDPVLHPEQPGIGSPSQVFNPQWAMAGGNLKIAAGNDIARVTQFADAEGATTTIADSSHQITSNWLYRRGHVDSTTGKTGAILFNDATGTPQEDAAASTTWWIDYSNFFQGFGALGGGNVDLIAANDVVNADAVAPTNARMSGRNSDNENLAPSAENLLEYGGGDVSIVAGRNIDGGLYYVERGQGLLSAGSAVKTNTGRSPSLGLLNRFDDTDLSDPDYFPESTWLPTALFIGKGGFEVSAKNDVLLGPLANAFLMPAGLGNKFWYKTYFSTFSPDTSVNVTSLGGSITFRNSTILPTDTEGTSRNILSAWMEQQNLFTVDNQAIASSNFQPWARLTESNLETFGSALNLSPPTLKTTAFTGDLSVVGKLLLAPAAKGNLELLAGGAMKGLQVAGKTETYSSAWIYSTINVSDANPTLIPSSLSPLSYYGFAGESGILYESNKDLLVNLDQALAESGSYSGKDSAIDLKIKRHGSGLLHLGDTNPVKIYATGGDFTGFNVFTPKATRLVAEGDITDVALYIQNLNKSDISIVAAAGDILPYNESSKIRTLATDATRGNKIFDIERNTASGKPVTALAGDIQVSGPGILEVLAGRNLDLGTGENLFDGTGVGITSIGNARNPNLPFDGASIIALAGIKGKNAGAALGLAESQLALSNLKDIDSTVIPLLPEFPTTEHEAVAGLQTLFALLQATGKNYPETGSYEPGLSAVQEAFASVSGNGDIFTRARDIRTVSGGSIVLSAPKGALTMASDIYGNPLTPPGIVTEYGGGISIITDGDVDIGRARIFTLRGGDMTIWSTSGDIAAGTSPKTVVTAPPTRVLIDSPSADVATDLGGLATGGGIGVLASVEGVEPGDVYLLAPAGSVDAGDAGIQSTGDLNIAAVAVINADNIAAGGTSVGVPSAAPSAPAPVSVSPGASTSTAATSSAAQSMASQNQEKKEVEETPSMISVEILGYGGGEGDGEKEEEAGQQSAML